jgi:AcrR family transcriptional regulator
VAGRRRPFLISTRDLHPAPHRSILVAMFTETSAGASSSGNEPAPRRGPGRPRGPTKQSAETRGTLYRVAISLFAAEGYENTTLRQIAAKAGVSPALLYRYFPSKRAVVLALYDELSNEFRRRAQAMPAGKWRDRYVFALETSLDVLAPHRDTLVALVPILVGGRDEGLFAPATEFSRSRVQSAFVEAVTGASDAPKRPDAEALGRALDLIHLAILLLWLLDRSAGQRATARFVAVVKRTMPAFALAYRLRVLRSLVHDLDAIARESLYGKSAA